jgi:hypothetical protein
VNHPCGPYRSNHRELVEFSAVDCNVLHEYAVGVNYNRLKIATDNVIYVYVSESFLRPRSYFLAGLSETSDTELSFVWYFTLLSCSARNCHSVNTMPYVHYRGPVVLMCIVGNWVIHFDLATEVTYGYGCNM